MIYFDMTFEGHVEKLADMIREATEKGDTEALLVYADMIDHRLDSFQIMMEVTEGEVPSTTNTQIEMWQGMMAYVSASAQLAVADGVTLRREANAAYFHALNMARELDIEAAEIAERVKSRLFEELDTDPST